jgi:hypothetical protein
MQSLVFERVRSTERIICISYAAIIYQVYKNNSLLTLFLGKEDN